MTDLLGFVLAGLAFGAVAPLFTVLYAWVLLKALKIQITKTIDDTIENLLQ